MTGDQTMGGLPWDWFWRRRVDMFEVLGLDQAQRLAGQQQTGKSRRRLLSVSVSLTHLFHCGESP